MTLREGPTIKKAQPRVQTPDGPQSRIRTNIQKQAVSLLEGVDFDLELARERAIALHTKLGLVDALIKKGIIHSSDQYAQLFSEVRFSKDGLDQVAEKLAQGRQWIPIFNPGNLKLAELWEILIADQGLDGSKVEAKYSNKLELDPIERVKRFRPFDTADFRVSEKYKEKHRYAELSKLGDLHAAATEEPQKPEIVFTNDVVEVDAVSKRPVDFIQDCQEGIRPIDLRADLIRWVTQFHNREKMPDQFISTIYPSWVDNTGNIAIMGVTNGKKALNIQGYYPTHSHLKVGMRPCLG